MFVGACGHIDHMKCEEAFDLAQSPVVCRSDVIYRNPECGHGHRTSCNRKTIYEETVRRQSDRKIVKAVVSVIEGREKNTFASFGLGIRCTEMVELIRKCKHKQRMACHDARFKTLECSDTVSVNNPLCGHQILIPCFMRARVLQWNPWPKDSGVTNQ